MPITTLPPELLAFLQPLRYAMLMVATSIGTVLLTKAPTEDIESCRGRRPITIDYELHGTPHGPVLRLVLNVPDERLGLLQLETFCNVADPDQLRDWRAMLAGDNLKLAFFDERHRNTLNKLLPPASPEAGECVELALAALAEVDPADRNFDLAKADVMARYPMESDRP